MMALPTVLHHAPPRGLQHAMLPRRQPTCRRLLSISPGLHLAFPPRPVRVTNSSNYRSRSHSEHPNRPFAFSFRVVPTTITPTHTRRFFSATASSSFETAAATSSTSGGGGGSGGRLLDRLWNPTDEHRALRDTVVKFVESEVEPQANEYNSNEAFNVDLFRTLGDLGLFGLTVDDEYGGVGSGFQHLQPNDDSVDTLDGRATAVVIVHEELASSDPAFCLSYLAHSLLLVNNLHVNATPQQKQLFLPSLVSGERIGGMGMSEPGAGTDVLGMKTTATYEPATDSWVLNGNKMWITNGCLDNPQQPGDTFLVYAKTGPQRTDLTSLVVEKGMPGFSVGQKIVGKLGMRASPTAELVFDNVRVPSTTHVIGDVHGATLCMMRNLEIERLGLAAMGLGIAKRCLNEMKSYASERKAFGHHLYQFGQIQRLMAESYAMYMAGRSYVYGVAQNMDLNSPGNGLDADGTKLFCAIMAKVVADNAVQVLGGNGYTAEYKVERLWRDAKLLEIGGGTNESHHKNMCRDLRKMGTDRIE